MYAKYAKYICLKYKCLFRLHEQSSSIQINGKIKQGLCNQFSNKMKEKKSKNSPAVKKLSGKQA